MQRFTLLTVLSSGLILGGLGCSGGSSDYKKTTELKKAPAVHEHHDHGAKGPHGGSIVELGDEEFHGEVVLDHDTHTLRVFVMGKDAKTAAPTSAKEVTLTPEGKTALVLKPVPQDGDGEGKSSRFELVDDDVIHALLDAKAIHGTLNLKINDTPYSGKVDYHLDDVHHDHKDDKPAGKPDDKTGDKPDDKTDAKPADPEPAKPADATNPETSGDKPAEGDKESK
jgi:hypothetical protein